MQSCNSKKLFQNVKPSFLKRRAFCILKKVTLRAVIFRYFWKNKLVNIICYNSRATLYIELDFTMQELSSLIK